DDPGEVLGPAPPLVPRYRVEDDRLRSLAKAAILRRHHRPRPVRARREVAGPLEEGARERPARLRPLLVDPAPVGRQVLTRHPVRLVQLRDRERGAAEGTSATRSLHDLSSTMRTSVSG